MELLSLIPLNDTMLVVTWNPIDSPYLDHYTVYYKPEIKQNAKKKSQVCDEEQEVAFPATSSSGVILGLHEGDNYQFTITVTYNISGDLYEGEKSDYISLRSGRLKKLLYLFIFGLICFLHCL